MNFLVIKKACILSALPANKNNLNMYHLLHRFSSFLFVDGQKIEGVLDFCRTTFINEVQRAHRT